MAIIELKLIKEIEMKKEKLIKNLKKWKKNNEFKVRKKIEDKTIVNGDILKERKL